MEQHRHIRYDRLKTVCEKALTESQKVLTEENIVLCYPSLVNSDQGRQVLETIKMQLIDTWRDNTKKEFDAIFEEREIEAKLNELDDLISEANSRETGREGENIPIDELKSTDILSSHLIPVKESQLETLKEQIKTLRRTNLDLLDELNGFKEEAKSVKEDITDSLETIKVLNSQGDSSNLEENLRKLINIAKTDEKDV